MYAGLRGIADYEYRTPIELFPPLVRKVVAMEPPPRIPFGRDAEVYFAPALAGRHQAFEHALADGWHTPEWVTP